MDDDNRQQFFVSAQVSEEMKNRVQQMAQDDGRSESSLLRWLISQDWNRRQAAVTTVQQNS